MLPGTRDAGQRGAQARDAQDRSGPRYRPGGPSHDRPTRITRDHPDTGMTVATKPMKPRCPGLVLANALKIDDAPWPLPAAVAD